MSYWLPLLSLVCLHLLINNVNSDCRYKNCNPDTGYDGCKWDGMGQVSEGDSALCNPYLTMYRPKVKVNGYSANIYLTDPQEYPDLVMGYTRDGGSQETLFTFDALSDQSSTCYTGAGRCQYANPQIIDDDLYIQLGPDFSAITTLDIEFITIDEDKWENQGSWYYEIHYYTTEPVDPTPQPTQPPTNKPTPLPTVLPTPEPTDKPTPKPTMNPTNLPSVTPTRTPSSIPTNTPTNKPTTDPTLRPSELPSIVPTTQPTKLPIIPGSPTEAPTPKPTEVPSSLPSETPTMIPTDPSEEPTTVPSAIPSNDPTVVPSQIPSIVPTRVPTQIPSIVPSKMPSIEPTSEPISPTAVPVIVPTGLPTIKPTLYPSPRPSLGPTVSGTAEELITGTSSKKADNSELILILVIVFLSVILCVVIAGVLFCIRYQKKQALLIESINNMRYKQALLAQQKIDTLDTTDTTGKPAGGAAGVVNLKGDNSGQGVQNGGYKPRMSRLSVVPGAMEEKQRKHQKFRGSVANYMARNKELDKLNGNVPGLGLGAANGGSSKYANRLSINPGAAGGAGRMSIMNQEGGAAPAAFSLNFAYNAANGQIGMVAPRENDYYEGFVSYTGDLALSTDSRALTNTLPSQLASGGENGGALLNLATKDAAKKAAKKEKMMKQQLEFGQMLGDARVAEDIIMDDVVAEMNEGDKVNGNNNNNNIIEENEDPAEAAGYVTKPIDLEESDDEIANTNTIENGIENGNENEIENGETLEYGNENALNLKAKPQSKKQVTVNSVSNVGNETDEDVMDGDMITIGASLTDDENEENDLLGNNDVTDGMDI